MTKEKIERLLDVVGQKIEFLQNNMSIKSQLWLNNGISRNDTNFWMYAQYKSLDNLRLELNKLNKRALKETEEIIRKVFIEEFKNISKELGDVKLPDEIEEKIKEITENVKNNTKILVDKTVENHKETVNKVVVSARAMTPLIDVSVNLQTQSTQILYDSIVKATSMGIQNMPKVVYADGRKVSFKSYIEMQTRTQLKQEASDYQEQAGQQLGVIFWLLSSHFDCADDHVKYQGRIYINRNWESKVTDEELKEKIKSFISSKKILFKEDVTTEGKLLQRPIEKWNCRHYFMPLTIEQALDCKTTENTNKLLKKLKMFGGKYESKNYVDLQQQRYNERKIRQYKAQLEKDELQLKSAPKNVNTDLVQKMIERDKNFIRKWETAQEDLIKQNKALHREEDREDPNIVKFDLGVAKK